MTDVYTVENLQVYQKLCDLHLEICDATNSWPVDERYELRSQVRRSTNSAPANLAEKHNDRHAKNRIEGVNRARGEVFESIHHLFMGHRKSYVSDQVYGEFKNRLLECVRMLNGLEKTYEKQLPPDTRRWND
ncbi:MAG: four helix bundle protein [Pirellulales bacterium]